MNATSRRASGTVDEVIPTDGLAEPLHQRLHGAGLAVNLHGRGPESHDLLLATSCSSGRQRGPWELALSLIHI